MRMSTMAMVLVLRVALSAASGSLILTVALLGLMPGRTAYAVGGLVVNNTADTDDGICNVANCTLREAINAANANPGADTIIFSVSGTIVLTATLPAVDDTVTMDGAGHAITIRGNNAVRVMTVNAGKELNLQSITIADGAGPDCGGHTCGGGIYNDGALNVTGSTFLSNSVSYGGGIYNSGALSVTGSAFLSNTAISYGGGIYNNGGTVTVISSTFSGNSAPFGGGINNPYSSTLTVTNSTFTGNSGSGIYNSAALTVISSTFSYNSGNGAGAAGGIYNGGNLILTGSIFLSNTAISFGGGIYNLPGATLIMTGSTFISNTATSAGGGIENAGVMTVTAGAFSGNSAPYGGVIDNSNSGRLSVSSSTFLSNSASVSGGGIYNDGTLTVTNSTSSGNHAPDGGVIYNSGSGMLTVTNSTFSGNSVASGGGIIYNSGKLNIVNTIIANSASGGDCLKFGPVTGSHNLIEDAAHACGFNNGTNGNLIGVDPMLGPLANNGGSTWTRVLLAGSPAINAGDNAACPPVDQRGIARPQGGVCDIGAVELLTTPRAFLPLMQR